MILSFSSVEAWGREGEAGSGRPRPLLFSAVAIALPDTGHAAGGDPDAAQHQFLGDARAVAGMRQGVIEDDQLDPPEFAPRYLLFHGHVAFSVRVGVARNSILTPARIGTATPAPRPRLLTRGHYAAVASCQVITVSAHDPAGWRQKPR